MPDLVIRAVALLGGLLVGVIAWTTVVLIMRASTLPSVDRLNVIRLALLGLLLLMVVMWQVSPVHGSPWIWPGVLVGIGASGLLFRLARTGRLRLSSARP